MPHPSAHRSAFESLLTQIRGEFRESVGLRLTRGQFRRLWNLRPDDSETIINRLIEGRFLREATDGALVRDES